MKFAVERADLVAALTRGGKIVKRNNTVPELNNVKVVARTDALWLTTTNVDSEFEIRCAAVVKAPGSTTVDHRSLADFVRLVPEGTQVEIECEGDTGKAFKIRAGRPKATFHTLPIDGFPESRPMGEGMDFSIGGAELAKALKRCAHAISNEETRYYLNGIYMHRAQDDEGQPRRLKFVATDGHRLALAHVDLNEDLPEFASPILPKAAVGELIALAEDSDVIDLAISAERIRAEVPGTIFSSKLIDGTYPDYERVIPRSLQYSLETSRLELASAARRVAVISEATKSGRAISITADKGLLRLTGKSGGQQIDDEIESKVSDPGTEIGCNVAYLADALESFNGNTIHAAYEGGNPIVLTDPGDDTQTQIVMPMRV